MTRLFIGAIMALAFTMIVVDPVAAKSCKPTCAAQSTVGACVDCVVGFGKYSRTEAKKWCGQHQPLCTRQVNYQVPGR